MKVFKVNFESYAFVRAESRDEAVEMAYDEYEQIDGNLDNVSCQEFELIEKEKTCFPTVESFLACIMPGVELVFEATCDGDVYEICRVRNKGDCPSDIKRLNVKSIEPDPWCDNKFYINIYVRSESKDE